MSRDLSQFIEAVELSAGIQDDGLRLDHFLVDKIFWRSRTDIQTRIRQDRVLVNDDRAKPATRMRPGDLVRVLVSPEDLPDQDPAKIELDVLAEDRDIVVLNKQPGLIVHPIGRHVYDTLMNALHLRYRLNGEADLGVLPHVVHRLDRDTSGVIVVAKNSDAKQFIQREFEQRSPRKEYLAIVEGLVEDDAGVIDLAIGSDEDARVRLAMKVRPDGLPSRTDFEVLERFAAHSLVRAIPKTGRQHQIRVHLAARGHPLLADPLYGDPHDLGSDPDGVVLLGRHALHAERLHLRHPATGAIDDWTADLAGDMAAILGALREGRTLCRLGDRQSSRWRRA